MIGFAVPLAARGGVAAVLAQANDPGGHGDDFGKSSPLGLLVLILFLISVAFLVRSMNKHLRRVPASFETAADAGAHEGGEADPPAGTGSGTGSGASGSGASGSGEQSDERPPPR